MTAVGGGKDWLQRQTRKRVWQTQTVTSFCRNGGREGGREGGRHFILEESSHDGSATREEDVKNEAKHTKTLRLDRRDRASPAIRTSSESSKCGRMKSEEGGRGREGGNSEGLSRRHKALGGKRRRDGSHVQSVHPSLQGFDIFLFSSAWTEANPSVEFRFRESENIFGFKLKQFPLIEIILTAKPPSRVLMSAAPQ